RGNANARPNLAGRRGAESWSAPQKGKNGPGKKGAGAKGMVAKGTGAKPGPKNAGPPKNVGPLKKITRRRRRTRPKGNPIRPPTGPTPPPPVRRRSARFRGVTALRSPIRIRLIDSLLGPSRRSQRSSWQVAAPATRGLSGPSGAVVVDV